jgi:uncharacterized protein YndB with AHSA1/START domain
MLSSAQTLPPTARTTRITRHFSAPAGVVYRALVDAEAVKAWKFPAGMAIRIHAFDARVGGRFRVSLTYQDPAAAGKSSAHTDTYSGHFQELVEGRRVVEVLAFETADAATAGEMKITYELTERGRRTELTATHENVPASVRLEDNEVGWTMAFDQLAAWVEDRSSPRREPGPPGAP